MRQRTIFHQLFCKHTKSDWYIKDSKFHVLSGERKYKLCNDCGKLLDTFFENNPDELYM